MTEGYIRLERKLFDGNLAPRGRYTRTEAWIWLLLNANWQDGLWCGIKVKRGELITSQVKLADKWHWSVSNVNYFLNLRKLENRIEITTTNQFTHIKILKYNEKNPLFESKIENEMKTKRKPIETIELRKERKKENTNTKVLVASDYVDFKETWKKLYGKYPAGGAVMVDYPIQRLVKAYTIEKVCNALMWAEANRETNKFIPTFNNPLELERKWNSLVNQARKEKNGEGKRIVEI